MPILFNHNYSPMELRELTGTLKQIAGIRPVEYTDGRVRGMRAAEVWTGSGFRFNVLLDRALDLFAAEHNGRALAWQHPALGTPDQYEPQGLGWLRTFGGGLVTTCGLTFFGNPMSEGGEEFGLHGRVSHLAAEQVSFTEDWIGDQYILEITGQVRQAVIFGENLLLTRRITTRLGANSVMIDDRVVNEGFRETPHMMLYHCNFGFPVVSPDSRLLIRADEVLPRTEVAAQGLDKAQQFEPPQPGFAEHVFFYRPHVGAGGMTRVAIVNDNQQFGAYLRYRAKELPYLSQWKMMGAGDYVCGLEPGNAWVQPRDQLRQEGRLRVLAPGEAVEYSLEIGALTDADAIANFEQELA